MRGFTPTDLLVFEIHPMNKVATIETPAETLATAKKARRTSRKVNLLLGPYVRVSVKIASQRSHSHRRSIQSNAEEEVRYYQLDTLDISLQDISHHHMPVESGIISRPGLGSMT